MRDARKRFAISIDEVKTSKFVVGYLGDVGIPGTSALIATVPSLPYPIAQVWYRCRGDGSIDIMNSWVMEPFRRRLGLRSKINDKLAEWYPKSTQIYSPAGTPEGEAWMKAYGYKKLKTGWHYAIKRSAKK